MNITMTLFTTLLFVLLTPVYLWVWGGGGGVAAQGCSGGLRWCLCGLNLQGFALLFGRAGS